MNHRYANSVSSKAVEDSGLLSRFWLQYIAYMKKRLIGHMPNNKYSITCVPQSIFSKLKKGLAPDAPLHLAAEGTEELDRVYSTDC